MKQRQGKVTLMSVCVELARERVSVHMYECLFKYAYKSITNLFDEESIFRLFLGIASSVLPFKDDFPFPLDL